MEILYDAEALIGNAESIREIKSRLTENMSNITALINGIGGEWKGDAEAAYEARLFCVRREFQSLEQFFEDYADLLERFGMEYKDCEDDYIVKLRNL